MSTFLPKRITWKFAQDLLNQSDSQLVRQACTHRWDPHTEGGHQAGATKLQEGAKTHQSHHPIEIELCSVLGGWRIIDRFWPLAILVNIS